MLVKYKRERFIVFLKTKNITKNVSDIYAFQYCLLQNNFPKDFTFLNTRNHHMNVQKYTTLSSGGSKSVEQFRCIKTCLQARTGPGAPSYRDSSRPKVDPIFFLGYTDVFLLEYWIYNINLWIDRKITRDIFLLSQRKWIYKVTIIKLTALSVFCSAI